MFLNFRLSRYPQLLIGLAGLLAISPLTLAAEHHLSGFATLGLVSNNNSELRFRRDINQDDGSHDNEITWITDSLVGAQWQGRWSDKFDTTIQVVAKDRSHHTIENSVEWAFIRYRPVDSLDFRVGRLGSDIFMLSEYRQVGYAFPWVRPPQDYYGFLSFYHFDGIDINKRVDLPRGTLNIKLFYGNSDEDYPTADINAPDVNLDFDPAGISFKLEWDAWRFRYSYSHVDVNNNVVAPLSNALTAVAPLWPDAGALARDLATNDKSIAYNEFGVGYDNNRWWVQTEAVGLRSDSEMLPTSRHFYLSVGRRIGSLSVFGIGGYAEPTRDVWTVTAPSGYPSPVAEQLAALAYATSTSLQGVRLEQKSYGAGARWDFASKMALKFQIEKFHVDANGSGLWLRNNPLNAGEHQHATVVTLAMDVLF